MNMVGLSSIAVAVTDPTGPWFESLNNRQLAPANLYQAQLAKRRKTTP